MDEHPMIEAWKERAAIMQFDAGMSEEAADLEAARDIFKIDFKNWTLARVHMMSLKGGRKWNPERMAA